VIGLYVKVSKEILNFKEEGGGASFRWGRGCQNVREDGWGDLGVRG